MNSKINTTPTNKCRHAIRKLLWSQFSHAMDSKFVNYLVYMVPLDTKGISAAKSDSRQLAIKQIFRVYILMFTCSIWPIVIKSNLSFHMNAHKLSVH